YHSFAEYYGYMPWVGAVTLQCVIDWAHTELSEIFKWLRMERRGQATGFKPETAYWNWCAVITGTSNKSFKYRNACRENMKFDHSRFGFKVIEENGPPEDRHSSLVLQLNNVEVRTTEQLILTN